MKKLLALILALMLTLTCLVACGEKSTDTDTEGTSSVSESDKTPADSEKEEADDSEKEEADDSEKEEADELNADTLVGLWTCEMGADMFFGADVGLKLEVGYDFKKDGSVEISMDIKKMVDGITLETFAKISGVSVEDMEAEMKKEGLTLDDVKELVMAQVEQGLAELGELKNGKVSASMNYKLEDGKIYLSEDKTFDAEEGESFTYENGTLSVGEIVLKKK